MAIFFHCACGQPLRADEAEEGGKKECLACGQLVLVPSLAQANQRLGIEAVPLLEIPTRPTPQPPQAPEPPALPRQIDIPVYRLRPEEDEDPDRAWKELERRQVRRVMTQAREALEDRPTRAPPWRLERHWYDFLAYPFRTWAILAILAFAWATLTAVVAAFNEEVPLGWEPEVLGPWLFLAALVFVFLSYTFAFYRCVYISAVDGEAGFVRWPGADMLLVGWSGLACLTCFLAGPVVPAVVGLLFWLNSGDLALMDYLILWELGLAAVGSWVLALLAVSASGRLRDANPVAWVRFAFRLDWRGWVVVALAALGGFGEVLLLGDALGEMHTSALGWLLVGWWGYWGGALVVYLARWYGVSRFRANEAVMRERENSLPEGPRRPSRGPGSSSIPPDHELVG